jgi:energy-converting hydrogenase Eha subunit E
MEASSRQQGSLAAAIDPRQKIYRDPFNELVVLVVSAVGASVLAPVLLLIVGAFTGEFSFLVFVAACVVIELLLIFGLARPQMKPKERVGWALLWGFTAAVLGAAFWELVFSEVL